MSAKIIHQDDLYNMVEVFAERNGLDETTLRCAALIAPTKAAFT